eukprot:1149118-Pelagomonas_calceolata.AAC.5
MGMNAFENNDIHPAHHFEHHIDLKQGNQCHPMWPARLSRSPYKYGHKGEIKPHCRQCVWVNPRENIWAEYMEDM